MRAVIEHKTSVSGRPSALTHREKIIRAMEENLLIEQVYEIGGVVDVITGIPEVADQILALLNPQEGAEGELATYDAGLLNDYGGGNVEWWQDYIRAELGRAHDFYASQSAPSPVPAHAGLVEALKLIADECNSEWHYPNEGRLYCLNIASEALSKTKEDNR